MPRLNPHKTGMALGGLIGLWHVVWAALVALNLAVPLMDFITQIHMVKFAYVIKPFDLGTAIILIIVTALIGYAFGYVFATISNRVQK